MPKVCDYYFIFRLYFQMENVPKPEEAVLNVFSDSIKLQIEC